MGAPPVAVIMNKDKWDALPADIQQIMTDPNLLSEASLMDGFYKNVVSVRDTKKVIDEAGLELATFQPTPDEKAKLASAALEVGEEWVSDREKEGLPGKEVFNKWLELVEKWDTFYNRKF